MDLAKWKIRFPGDESSIPGVELEKPPGDGRFWRMDPLQFAPPEKSGETTVPAVGSLPRPWKPGADATKEK